MSYSDIMEHADSRSDLALRVRLKLGAAGLGNEGLSLDTGPGGPGKAR